MNLFFALAPASGEGQQGSPWTMILMVVGMGALMYFMAYRPQKKRQKEEQALRDNIEVGDEITTIGGIMGRVVTVKEDTIIIESGADRTKLKLLRGSVGVNNTANEKLQAEREEKQANLEKERAEKEEAKKKGKK